MIASIFYITAYMLMLVGLIIVKKNDKAASLFEWIGVSVLATFCYQAAVGALYWKTGIPVSIVTVGVANLLAGIVLIILAVKRGRQKLVVYPEDVIACVVTLVLAGYYLYRKFGLALDINFISIDSAVHMRFAKVIATEHRIPSTMFFAAINSGLPMETAIPVIGVFDLYKIFILWETGYLFLSGYMFYILIRRFMLSRGTKTLAILSIAIYITGYPLYSYIFGFSYFGLSISLIAYIIYMASALIGSDIDNYLSYTLLGLGLFGLFLCYMMFVPVVYLGVFVAIVIAAICTDRLISKRTILRLLGVFLVPSILGLLLTFANLLYLSPVSGGSGSSSGGGIASDGGCYNDMYSNFIFISPLILTGIILAIGDIKEAYLRKKEDGEKKKDRKVVLKLSDCTAELIVVLSIAICLVSFMLFLFAMAMQGKVSVYYYVRNNNVLMLLAAVLCFRTIVYLYSKAKPLAISGYILIFIFLLMIRFNVDAGIQHYNERFIREGVEQTFDIYRFNHDFVNLIDPLNGDDIAVYKYMRDNAIIDEEDKEPEILVVGGPTFTMWFSVMSDCSHSVQINDYGRFAGYDLSNIKYICVQKTEVYDSNKETFDNLGKIVLNNTRGIVIEME